MTEAIRQGDIPGVQLRCRQELALPPEEVWRWLVEPARLVRWIAGAADIADVAEIEPGPRGALVLAGRAADGTEWRERGTTLEHAPPRRWVLAFERLGAGWGAATRLDLEVHPRAGGAELDVLHGGFQRLPLSIGLTVWSAYRARWRDALARLAEVSQSTPE
jgi:uncharacterized protein YndB with AHSA1/START domain